MSHHSFERKPIVTDTCHIGGQSRACSRHQPIAPEEVGVKDVQFSKERGKWTDVFVGEIMGNKCKKSRRCCVVFSLERGYQMEGAFWKGLVV